MSSGSIRAFVALDIPENIREDLRERQDALRSRGLQARWVRPAGIHLTVRFLGQVPASTVPVVSAALEQAVSALAAPQLALADLGVFPNLRRPRVIWAGLKGEIERLREIKRAVDRALAAADSRLFPREERSFKAHLTLARFKKRVDPDRLRAALKADARFAPQAFTARRLVLYRSELSARGPRYTPLDRWWLPSAGENRDGGCR